MVIVCHIVLKTLPGSLLEGVPWGRWRQEVEICWQSFGFTRLVQGQTYFVARNCSCLRRKVISVSYSDTSILFRRHCDKTTLHHGNIYTQSPASSNLIMRPLLLAKYLICESCATICALLFWMPFQNGHSAKDVTCESCAALCALLPQHRISRRRESPELLQVCYACTFKQSDFAWNST